MSVWLLVGVGGALGSMARFGLSGLVHRYLGMSFPYGTFTVNIFGCLVFGAIASAGDGRFGIGPSGRALVLTGVIGGFTTFSAFSFETFALLRDGKPGLAAINVGGQVAVGLVAIWIGYTIPRAL